MNRLLSLAAMTMGMSQYRKILRTQSIQVVYANQYRLRLKSKRWQNKHVHVYMVEQGATLPGVIKVSGSPEIGTLAFVFAHKSLTQDEFNQFLQDLVTLTDQAYVRAPVTALNRLYDGKVKVDDIMKRATMGLVDTDTAIFSYTLFQGIRTFSSTPQVALGFLWWSYTILERANRKRAI
ncbi:HMA2 domain-containing protein [Lacticaseibacillus paracasei]|uniref:HMA2 domain-containing protein n=1 Tax=Lacticaseibacillus paracasei TaxID=1597 RepID=UPI0011C79778|nr:hypothetical protein [Lacticaseibacillus paracasei]TXJ64345.1 hypothetical protein FGO89_11810 [Lacticaseibacillus paracasei]